VWFWFIWQGVKIENDRWLETEIQIGYL